MSGAPIGALTTAALLSAATIIPALTPAASPAPESPDRPADQTFLTYPEWFLVFSPDERASYLTAGRPPSRFPYFGHIEELWDGYAAVREATRPYPFNTGYHVMIVVIATSTTVEYGLDAAYETLVGRAFEALPTSPAGPTLEDTFAAKGARAYVDFIKVRPWYEFDFAHWVAALWHEPIASQGTLPRSLERRFWITTEYGGKAIYGALIAKATAASYAPAVPKTRVVVDALPGEDASALPELTRVSSDTSGVVADVPRYQAFTDYARALARGGVRFRRIAGNDGPIALTAIVPLDWEPPSRAPREPLFEPLFQQPLLTVPGRSRMLLVTDVPRLSETLVALDVPGIAIEHVFDY